jgi:hypothetical protein
MPDRLVPMHSVRKTVLCDVRSLVAFQGVIQVCEMAVMVKTAQLQQCTCCLALHTAPGCQHMAVKSGLNTPNSYSHSSASDSQPGSPGRRCTCWGKRSHSLLHPRMHPTCRLRTSPPGQGDDSIQQSHHVLGCEAGFGPKFYLCSR